MSLPRNNIVSKASKFCCVLGLGLEPCVSDSTSGISSCIEDEWFPGLAPVVLVVYFKASEIQNQVN